MRTRFDIALKKKISKLDQEKAFQESCKEQADKENRKRIRERRAMDREAENSDDDDIDISMGSDGDFFRSLLND